MSQTDRQERTIDAVIFDLDGVVTRTARLHAAAWKRLFDDYLAQRAAQRGKRGHGSSFLILVRRPHAGSPSPRHRSRGASAASPDLTSDQRTRVA